MAIDVKNISRTDNLTPARERLGPQQKSGDASFKDAFEALNRSGVKGSAAAAGELQSLKFSSHAIDRMKSRGIHISPHDLSRLEQAVAKADKKGAKDSLVLMGDSAFVVSVKNKTVVTVMDRAMMKDNVFTNIDSTIVM